MSLFPLDKLLAKVVSYGDITVIDTDGTSRRFGTPGSGPSVAIRLHDDKVKWALALKPRIAIGEAYTDGRLTIEKGTLREFLDVLLISSDRAFPPPASGRGKVNRMLRQVFHRRGIINKIGRARDNVHHHYDIGQPLYELFLDRDLQYSCAYFRHEGMTLEEAQEAKKQHLAKKLLLKPGMRVLDIGCGWGGLALHLARNHNVHVTGVTLSDDQFAVATRRAREAGLANRIEIKLQDYRHEKAQYDRIISVGMFEHVGRPQFREYFGHVKRLLSDDGVAVIHSIGKNTPPEPINAWIARYIFPGSYLPTLSELTPIFEDMGLWLTDMENWRLHYAKTLHEWDARVQKNRATIAKMFDERFVRMWEFYLQSCEAGFRHQGLSVFQMQLAKKVDAVPLTRDYLLDEPEPARFAKPTLVR
jgi:cyclopropane-fatty-acyl-phospholipid synthase